MTEINKTYYYAIHKLWDKYYTDGDNTEAEARLKKMAENNSSTFPLENWLRIDIVCVLKRTQLNEDVIEGIKEIVKNCTVDMDKCIDEARIRMDFAAALRGVKNGRALSYPLNFGFSSEDLLRLLDLHKRNKFRKKIEDLLEDCNFHHECGMLSGREYDKLEAELNKRISA